MILDIVPQNYIYIHVVCKLIPSMQKFVIYSHSTCNIASISTKTGTVFQNVPGTYYYIWTSMASCPKGETEPTKTSRWVISFLEDFRVR